jgi:FkbH-like protein
MLRVNSLSWPSWWLAQGKSRSNQSAGLSVQGRKRCAGVLRQHRLALAHALRERALPKTERWAKELASFADDRDGFAERHLTVVIDYLARFLEAGDTVCRDLAAGEILNIISEVWLADASTAVSASEDRSAATAGAFVDTITDFLAGQLDAPLANAAAAELAAIKHTFAAPITRKLEVLLVGDCVFVDILPFLMGPGRADGIAITPTFLTSKNQASIRSSLAGLAERTFDLIVFSPFTYEYSPEYAQLLDWKKVRLNRTRLPDIVDHAIEETGRTIDALARHFSCTIIVHNSSAVIREGRAARQFLKSTLTAPLRRRAADLVNTWLRAAVSAKNRAGHRQFFIFDETRLVASHGERALGRYLHVGSSLQHPARFGPTAAPRYHDILYAHAWLLKKKLIVCDLDNTLWDGVIGEGAVRHHTDRQRILFALRQRGVLLAINSKNDPARVRFDGGVLAAADFVATRVNWEPKARNMKAILAELNLKSKDTVFIDDRADERALMTDAFNDVLTLDATAGRTWELLRTWADFADDSMEGDRTKLYHERKERQKFIEEKGQTAGEEQAALVSLGLKMSLRPAGSGELRRVTDLINRTNQFNLCASRVDQKQVNTWHASATHHVLVVEVADKFGDMGIVSVIVLEVTTDEIRIPIYVLSCRVFGYGIEQATLNRLKRLAVAGQRKIVGWYQPSAYNAPCRETYRTSGFVDCGTHWECAAPQPAADAPWLTINDGLAIEFPPPPVPFVRQRASDSVSSEPVAM